MEAEPIKPNSAEFIRYLNFLRTSEMLGVHYLLRILRLARDPAVIGALHRHLAEEANHARLWANTIIELGGSLYREDAYQKMIVQNAPAPRSAVDIVALNIVTERRAMLTYTKQAQLPGLPRNIRRVLKHLIRDESWHIEWQEDWLADLVESRGQTVEEALDRYRPHDVAATRKIIQGVGRGIFPESEAEAMCRPV